MGSSLKFRQFIGHRMKSKALKELWLFLPRADSGPSNCKDGPVLILLKFFLKKFDMDHPITRTVQICDFFNN